jgi:hypothetical protein
LTQTPEPTDFSQPGTNQPKYVTSPVALVAGTTYTLVIEGEVVNSCPNCGTSYRYDGVYQYDQSPGPASPKRCCIDLQIAGHEGHPTMPGDTPAQSVPFDSKTHHYEVNYTAPFSGALEVRDVMRYAACCSKLTGKIEVELFGSGSGGSPKLPALTPQSATPKLGVPIDYRVMALGAVGSFKAPRVPKGIGELDTDIQFVDDQGNPVEGPSEEAISEQAARGAQLCYVLLRSYTPDEQFANQQAFATGYPEFARCSTAVATVLARADQIRKQKAGGARVAATGGSCLQVVGATRKQAKPDLRVTCTTKGDTTHVRIRPRSGRRLAKALGGHAPQLVVGRSGIPAGAATRLRVRWHAK